MWASIRYYVIIIAVMIGVTVLSSTISYFIGRYDGSTACDARHDAAQLKQNVKRGKADAKRDSQIPVGDRAVQLKWLFDNARK